MLRSAAPAGSALGAHDERHRKLAPGHEVRLRRLVDELIERERDEVDEHDLDDGSKPALGGADRDTADGALADRRVEHPVASELLGEAGGGQVGAALGDVLAEHDHPIVLTHRLRERPRDRLDEGDLGRRLVHA